MERARLTFVHDRLEIDLGRRELRVGGVTAAIGDRAFEILATLVGSAGNLVTKEEIARRVWSGAAAQDNTLEVHVSALRRALGTDRGLLKTHYGRGYRLTGSWSAVAGEPPRAAPTPETARQPRNTLPIASTTLIGRTAAVGHLRKLLSANRIVTLTGIGGIGKTRLAIEVARAAAAEAGTDACFVDLAAIGEPSLVPSAAAHALGVRLGNDHSSAEAVARAIGRRATLLVLDNCEHLVDAAARLTDAVARFCARASVLATSREALRVDGEHVYRVPPLEVVGAGPLEARAVMRSSAAELFLAQARARNASFMPTEDEVIAIGEICRQLDGIPLAIEFAAARAAAIGVRQVADGLSDRFGLLTVGQRTALARHRTLRATLDWSYDQLSQEEAGTLNSLAVFAGEFPLEAAIAVVGDLPRTLILDCITGLVAKSLVLADLRDGIQHYRLLDTVRHYAMEKLRGSGRHAATARRHAEHFLAVCAQAERELGSREEADWLAMHGRHLDNLRAALDWAFSPQGDAAIGRGLTLGALPIWLKSSLMQECRGRVEQALRAAPDSIDPRVAMRLSAALAVAMFYTQKGAVPEVAEAWTRVLSLADQLDDNEHRLWARWGLWNFKLNRGLFRRALLSAQHFRELAVDPADRAAGARKVGVSLHYLGEHAAARTELESVLSHPVERTGRSMLRVQYDQKLAARSYLPRVLWVLGFPDQAMQAAREVARDARSAGQALALSLALVQAACPVALLTGNLVEAEEFVAALLEQATTLGLGFWRAEGECYAGALRARRGDVEGGLGLFRPAIQALRDYGTTMNVTGYLMLMAAALAETEAVADGAALVAQGLAKARRDEDRWCLPELLRLEGEFLLRAGAEDAASAAEAAFRAAMDCALEQQAPSWQLRAATSQARLLLAQGRGGEARAQRHPILLRFGEGLDTADLVCAKAVLDAAG